MRESCDKLDPREASRAASIGSGRSYGSISSASNSSKRLLGPSGSLMKASVVSAALTYPPLSHLILFFWLGDVCLSAWTLLGDQVPFLTSHKSVFRKKQTKAFIKVTFSLEVNWLHEPSTSGDV